MLADEFRHMMRRLASGVAVITTRDGEGRRFGMAATSVTSLSVDPPSVLVCINKSASFCAPMLETGRFSVNLLTAAQGDQMECFGARVMADKRFSFGNWVEPEGLPPYLEDALASVDCAMDQHWEYGTHRIVVGRALSIRRAEGGAGPLVYFDGNAHRLTSADAPPAGKK